MRLPERVKDLTGHRVARLVAMEYLGNDGRRSLWRIRCDCGRDRVMVGSRFVKGEAKTCGLPPCTTEVRSEGRRGKNRTHGMSKHPSYAVWRAMLARCQSPKHPAWHNYGGRGITVCPRWATFEKFWEDMGPTYRPGLTIDRVDNGAGYAPGNCRWATRKQQSRNQRRNVYLDTPQGRMTAGEASERSGINLTTLLYRKSIDWPAEKMFDPPAGRKSATS